MSVIQPQNFFLPAPQRGKISLVIAPRSVTEKMMVMLATLALRGKVRVVDGGNRFDAYALARELRKQTVEVRAALTQVILSRVFTCYQLTATLEQLPLDGIPLVVLDLLGTFIDENVAFPKRQRLLHHSLAQLQQISVRSPVALWVRTRSNPTDEDPQLITQILEITSDLWEMQDQIIPDHQLPLF